MRFLLASILLLAAVPLAASELTVDIPFDQTRVCLDDAGPYTKVSVQGLPSYHGEGLPALPIMPVRIALPTGCRAQGIEVVDAQYTSLRGSHEVMPSAAPVPFSVEQRIVPVEPDPRVYEGDVTFPARRVEFRSSGPFMGIPIATAVVYPVRWNAADGGLEVLSSMTVRVSYEYDADMTTVSRRTAESESRARSIAENMVVNPGGVSPSGAAIVAPRELAYGEYVIVTHPDYETQAQELADWKTAKGVPASVYTTTWVDGEYSTTDLQQDIRAFFHDCVDEGAEFALIYGDDSKIEARMVYVDGSTYDELPSDLYFKDLNDTAPGADQWDSNGNGIWGEDSDNIQWDPDLWVGRAAVTSTSEADIFNEKVFIYEGVESAMPAGADYFETAPRELRVGYSTGILWSSPYTPGKANADTISKYVPVTTWEEEFCCESGSGNSSTITFNMINDGPHHVMHASHGSQTSMWTSAYSDYTTSQIMDQTNISSGHLPAIWNSISCHIGWMDGYECCAEAWLNSPEGGGFGAFNSRYGCG
ncbi:MAG: C25 family cysteine peptidase, partial [Candidatus Fermentibacterota bacterium]